jgi:beta-fructofuranosidase
MESVKKAIPLASTDPDRPRYHFHPPANWNNDPNGTLFYKGCHHLFYQLNPFAANPGNQHWGHARSKDLVNWEHLPIAIGPSPEKGERAIYSGAAMIAHDGRPRLFYTSIGHPQPEQWMVVPEDDDLFSWSKFSGNPVLTSAAHGSLGVNQWRDPFLFREAGQVYMVCGGNASTGRGGAGQVQLYQALKDDLSEWKHLGVVFQALERETYNIECPNLFQLDGKWVLIISPHRPCEYFIGTLDIDKVKFTPETHGILDAGAAYASNISRDDQGRTILWLWGRTNTPQGHGWNGVMTMPRVLSVGADGFLRQQVPREFDTLRGPVKTFAPGPLGDRPVPLESVPGDAAEIEAAFSTPDAATFGFEVSRAGRPALTIAIERGTLIVGNARAYVGNVERYKLRLFLDKRCLEVYVNDGAVALYNFIDAQPGDQQIAVFARKANVGLSSPEANRLPLSVRLESLQAWPMKSASFNLDHFHL